MSFIGSMFSGSNGAGFQGVSPSQEQLQNAYGNTQTGIQQQQAFVNAMNGMGGLGNQANVFSQQQGLADQLQGVANGTGSNPAMAQLNQTTGANVANQAALMAGQRGSGANAGLMARLAAQQGGNLQQQAVGQGATMGAQQQLAGMQMLGNQQSNMANLANTQIGQQQAGLNALNQSSLQQQSNLMGLQQNANSANAGIAGGNQAAQGNLFGGALSGVASAVSPLVSGLFKAQGGMVEGYADGGIASDPLLQPVGNVGVTDRYNSGPTSGIGRILENNGQPSPAQSSSNAVSKGGFDSGNLLGGALGQGLKGLLGGGATSTVGTAGPWELGGGLAGGAGDAMGALGGAFEGGGALAGAGEGIMEVAPAVLAANQGGKIDKLKKGGEVPGQANVPGDSIKNDKVPAVLSPGEIVIPRSIAMHPNAPQLAAQFVAQALAKGGSGKQNFDDGGTAGFMAPQEFDQLGRPIGQEPDPGHVPLANKFFQGAGQPQTFDRLGRPVAMAPQAAPAQAMKEQAPSPENVDLGGGISGGGQKQGGSNPMAKYDPNEGLRMQERGIQNEANIQGDLAEKNAGLYKDQAHQLELINYQAQQNAFNHNQEVQSVVDDMKKDKIDPNAYINNMGTGQRIASAIGLVLGGMGGGLTHQENPAAKFLNDQINRDIEGQKMNMGKKQNLLSALEKQYGNQQDALKMAHSIYSAKLIDQINEEAAKAGTTLAQARAQQLIGPLRQQINQNSMELGFRQAAMDSMKNGGSAETAIPFMVPKEQQGKAIEAYGKISELNKLHQSMRESAEHLHGKLLNGALSPNDTASAKQAFAGAVQKLSEGRYNGDAAQKIVDSLLPQTADMGKTTYDNKMKRMDEFFDSFRKEPETVLKTHYVPTPQMAPRTRKLK